MSPRSDSSDDSDDSDDSTPSNHATPKRKIDILGESGKVGNRPLSKRALPPECTLFCMTGLENSDDLASPELLNLASPMEKKLWAKVEK